MRRSLLLALTAGFTGGLASPAGAAEHLMLVNEVFPSGAVSQQFVELKNPVGEPFPSPTYVLGLHAGDGGLIRQQNLNPSGFRGTTAPYLIANSAPRDADLMVDPLPAAGGQLCFYRAPLSAATRINCLGYGSVSNPLGDTGPLPPPGQSLQRLACGDIGAAAPTRDAENAACSSGGGGGGGGAGGGADATDPSVRLRAGRRQDVDKLALVLRSNEDATATVRASVSVPRGAARTIRFRTVKRSLKAGVRRRVRLRLTRRRKRAVKRALARGRRLRARIRISVRDKAGNTTVKRLRVRLRR